MRIRHCVSATVISTNGLAVRPQPLEQKLWEGALVGYKDSVGRPVRLVELVF